MDILRKYKHLILLVTVPVLLLFMSNSIMNRHSHLVRGYTYSHAHPFKNGQSDQSYPGHSHNDAELLILDLMASVDFILVLILIALWPVLEINKLLQRSRNNKRPVLEKLTYSLRGPPLYS